MIYPFVYEFHLEKNVTFLFKSFIPSYTSEIQNPMSYSSTMIPDGFNQSFADTDDIPKYKQLDAILGPLVVEDEESLPPSTGSDPLPPKSSVYPSLDGTMDPSPHQSMYTDFKTPVVTQDDIHSDVSTDTEDESDGKQMILGSMEDAVNTFKGEVKARYTEPWEEKKLRYNKMGTNVYNDVKEGLRVQTKGLIGDPVDGVAPPEVNNLVDKLKEIAKDSGDHVLRRLRDRRDRIKLALIETFGTKTLFDTYDKKGNYSNFTEQQQKDIYTYLLSVHESLKKFAVMLRVEHDDTEFNNRIKENGRDLTYVSLHLESFAKKLLSRLLRLFDIVFDTKDSVSTATHEYLLELSSKSFDVFFQYGVEKYNCSALVDSFTTYLSHRKENTSPATEKLSFCDHAVFGIAIETLKRLIQEWTVPFIIHE
jgi:hypothetical protein